jgi:ABC-2 type transport system permease protein
MPKIFTPQALHNIWLIARREYLERIRTKAFLIATIMIPALMGGLGFGSAWIGSHTKSSAHIAVLSSDPVFARDLKQELETGRGSAMTVDLAPDTPAVRSRLDQQLKDGKSRLAGYLRVLPPPTPAARPKFIYKPRSASDISTNSALRESAKAVLTRERLSGQGMAAADIEGLMAPVEIDTSASGDTTVAFFAAYILFFLMYMVIMLYGMNTARSIIEEKSSRIFEVMLATIQPDEMLAGKILGVGSVGLTQVGVWMIAAVTIGTVFSGTIPGSVAGHSILSAGQIAFFVAYFLFGFLLYSSVAAALGAMTNSEQELQQLNMFLVLPLAFSMLMLFSIIKDPDSTLSRIVSLIPFCSPLLMNFRVSIGNPQPWEEILSFVLMSLTILAILWFASRIYRVGILMYGKKPNLPEILRWLKYS